MNKKILLIITLSIFIGLTVLVFIIAERSQNNQSITKRISYNLSLSLGDESYVITDLSTNWETRETKVTGEDSFYSEFISLNSNNIDFNVSAKLTEPKFSNAWNLAALDPNDINNDLVYKQEIDDKNSLYCWKDVFFSEIQCKILTALLVTEYPEFYSKIDYYKNKLYHSTFSVDKLKYAEISIFIHSDSITEEQKNSIFELIGALLTNNIIIFNSIDNA